MIKILLLVVSIIVCIPLVTNAADNDQPSNLWINSGDIFLDVLSSPANGTLAGYSAAIGFTGMAYWALRHDVDWFYAVQDRRNDWQDKIIPPVNLLGDGFFHLGAYGALYQFGRPYDKRVATMAMEGQINVAIFSVLIKSLSSSARPSVGHYERDWFTFKFSNNSFPSGHTMTAFCAAAIIGDAYHCEWLTFPIAGLVGYARIYSRRHWPADVVTGAGLGLLIGYTVVALHANDREDREPSMHFNLLPNDDGGKLVLSWRF